VTRIAPLWLSDPATRAVAAALAPAGPLFVGGCVRDALLGREAADVDLCVATPPEETTRLLEAAGLRVIPTGIDHGTVTAVAGKRGFEVTTLRRDVETFGRRARIAFTADVAEDAARRDFTMNALYAAPDGVVIDPLGGLADLRARRVRFIGDPHARIQEDFLRILRFFRFTARFSAVGVDPEGLAACAAHIGGLAGLARERIGHEMKRLLSAEDPSAALAAMADAGVLAAVAEGADPTPLATLVASERVAAASPSWTRRLGAMGGWAVDWRLSKAESRRLEALRAALAAAEPPAIAAQRHGSDAARDAALIRAAGQGPPADLEAEIARGAVARFPLSARDLIAAGMAPGPPLGAALDRLREVWIASDLRAGKAALLARL
jgi:poly(A) polymerase